MDYKNDYEIIYAIREVDFDKKQLLFEKYLPIIKSIAYIYHKNLRTIGVDVEDFIQEGYIGLNSAINSYDENKEAMFSTYATLCVKRQIGNFARKYYRTREIKEYRELQGNEVYQVADSSINYVMSEYYNEELIKKKNDLSFLQSCAFELKFNGFSYKEIAVLLDIKVKEVDSLLYKTRKIFKNSNLSEILK